MVGSVIGSSANEANIKQPTLSESIAHSAKYILDNAQTKELNCAVIYYTV